MGVRDLGNPLGNPLGLVKYQTITRAEVVLFPEIISLSRFLVPGPSGGDGEYVQEEFVIPEGVYSLPYVAAISSGGASGMGSLTAAVTSGSGGDYRWLSDISVKPGDVLLLRAASSLLSTYTSSGPLNHSDIYLNDELLLSSGSTLLKTGNSGGGNGGNGGSSGSGSSRAAGGGGGGAGGHRFNGGSGMSATSTSNQDIGGAGGGTYLPSYVLNNGYCELRGGGGANGTSGSGYGAQGAGGGAGGRYSAGMAGYSNSAPVGGAGGLPTTTGHGPYGGGGGGRKTSSIAGDRGAAYVILAHYEKTYATPIHSRIVEHV